MNEQGSNAGNGNIEGKMLLYSQPELLTVQDHGQLGINVSAQSYDSVRSVRAIPITAAELPSAQRNYPIVFSGLQEPMLLAIVGLRGGSNLFVKENGKWDENAYIPAYVRCHPFALAPRPDDNYAVVIDRAASIVSDNAEQPIFDGKKLTPPIQARVDFCVQFDAHSRATKAFCDKLAELKLLSGQEATFKPDDSNEERTIASYVAVDFDKLKELDAEMLKQLFLDGTLAAIYAHRFSLDNWFRLLERGTLRRSGG